LATARELANLARATLIVLGVGVLAGGDTESLPAAVPDLSLAALAAAGAGGVADGRARFRAVYCDVRERHGQGLPDDRPCGEALRQAADEPAPDGRPLPSPSSLPRLRVLVVSGIYGACAAWLATPFADALAHLGRLGYRVGQLPVDARSGSARNAELIRDYLAAHPSSAGERLVLVGYSKGIADILEGVAAHSGVREAVGAVVSVAGAVGGSPHADDLADPLRELLRRIDLPGCNPGDGGGIDSLRRSTRAAWLAANRHRLPGGVRYYSVVAAPGPGRVSAVLRPAYRRLAGLDPRNDSQVLWADAVIPGGTLLGYVDADHWAAALPLVRSAPPGLGAGARVAGGQERLPAGGAAEAVVRYVGEELAAVVRGS
jgi:hypothetical protein